MQVEPIITLQLRWQDLSISAQASGVLYSPDLMNDFIAQCNRGFRTLLKDTSEYDFDANSEEVDGYMSSTLEAMDGLLTALAEEQAADDFEEDENG